MLKMIGEIVLWGSVKEDQSELSVGVQHETVVWLQQQAVAVPQIAPTHYTVLYIKATPFCGGV